MRHPSHDAQTLLPLVYNSQPQAKYFPVWPPHSVSKYIVFRLRYSLYLKVQFFFRSLTLRRHLQSQMSIIKILFLWNMMTVLEKSSGWLTDRGVEKWKHCFSLPMHFLMSTKLVLCLLPATVFQEWEWYYTACSFDLHLV